MRLATQGEVENILGEPIKSTNGLVKFISPFPLRIAWDLKKVVHSFYVHPCIHEAITGVFNDLMDHYGEAEIMRLGINLFGGVYNYRPQRGTERWKNPIWSKHAWAIAIDLDPGRNGLKTKAPKAQFSKPEYKAMIDIFYKHGFVGLGPEKNMDWMHFEYSAESLKKYLNDRKGL